MYKDMPLPVSHIKKLSDTSAADDFWHDSAKTEIAQNEQILLLSECFQLFSEIIPTFIELFPVFAWMFSKWSAADLLYVGKGYLDKGYCSTFPVKQPFIFTLSINDPNTNYNQLLVLCTKK